MNAYGSNIICTIDHTIRTYWVPYVLLHAAQTVTKTGMNESQN
jgi:hypothetical protein